MSETMPESSYLRSLFDPETPPSYFDSYPVAISYPLPAKASPSAAADSNYWPESTAITSWITLRSFLQEFATIIVYP